MATRPLGTPDQDPEQPLQGCGCLRTWAHLRQPPTPNRQLFFNGTEPLGPQDPFPWPALAATLETVAREGAEAFYSGQLGRTLLEDIAQEGEPPEPGRGPPGRARLSTQGLCC